MAQKVSDILKKQDADTARGVVQVLTAMQERYGQSLELRCAIRDLGDFATKLTPERSPVDQLAKRTLEEMKQPA